MTERFNEPRASARADRQSVRNPPWRATGNLLPLASEITLADKHSYATTSFAYLSLEWIVALSAP